MQTNTNGMGAWLKIRSSVRSLKAKHQYHAFVFKRCNTQPDAVAEAHRATSSSGGRSVGSRVCACSEGSLWEVDRWVSAFLCRLRSIFYCHSFHSPLANLQAVLIIQGDCFISPPSSIESRLCWYEVELTESYVVTNNYSILKLWLLTWRFVFLFPHSRESYSSLLCLRQAGAADGLTDIADRFIRVS